jgi:hypothetical protein
MVSVSTLDTQPATVHHTHALTIPWVPVVLASGSRIRRAEYHSGSRLGTRHREADRMQVRHPDERARPQCWLQQR